MKQTGIALVAVVLWVGVSSASMVVDLHDQPMVEAILERRGDPPVRGGLVDVQTKSNQPIVGLWFVPYYRADKLHDGDSTYFSIRSEGSPPSSVLVEFFDPLF